MCAGITSSMLFGIVGGDVVAIIGIGGLGQGKRS